MRETGSETVHRNPWFTVVRRRYEGERGERYDYFMVSKPDSVLVVVRHGRRFVLVDLERPTFDGARSLEFPQGGIEKGESPSSAAAREVLEETGLRLTGLRPLGVFAECSGFATTSCHVFLADAGGPGPADPVVVDPFEATLRVRLLSWDELGGLARTGGIQDSATLAALAMVREPSDADR